jgi:4'-phosphopantetheinyl transferase
MRSAPVLAAPAIHVARSADWATPGADRALDGPGRRRRDGLLLQADRDDFVAARFLAAEAVGQVACCAVGSVVIRQSCEGCGSPGHGAPVVVRPDGMHVSWSHARGLVAVIASRDRVGIDLERVRHLDADVIDFALAPGERAPAGGPVTDADVIGRWTRKEALVKVGAFQLDDFPKIDLGPAADAWDDWLLCGRPVAGAEAMVAVASQGGRGRAQDRDSRAAVQVALARAAEALDRARVPMDA